MKAAFTCLAIHVIVSLKISLFSVRRFSPISLATIINENSRSNIGNASVEIFSLVFFTAVLNPNPNPSLLGSFDGLINVFFQQFREKFGSFDVNLVRGWLDVGAVSCSVRYPNFRFPITRNIRADETDLIQIHHFRDCNAYRPVNF